MGKERSRKKPSFSVIFWIAVILLVILIFLFNLPSIRTVLDNTDFVEVVFEQRDRDTELETDPVPEEGTQAEPERFIPPDETDTGEDTGESEISIAPTEQTAEEQEITLVPPTVTEEPTPEMTRTATLFFIRVSDDGRILAEPVQRTVRFSGGPLTSTIETLVSGPSAEDLNRGLLSLIPSGTALLSARVQNGVAYLNFNESFRFNTMGLEGYLAQLQQIIHTATVFSTVDAVQILINGEIVDYLGGDGVYVGKPLTQNDL